jgi:hypothetical protein
MMVPLSATYHAPVPMPEINPPKMMYCETLVLLWVRLIRIDTYPLVAKFAVAIVRRALDWEGHCTYDQGPLDTKLVHKRSSEKADECEHNVVDSAGDVVGLCRSKTTTAQTYGWSIMYSLSRPKE